MLESPSPQNERYLNKELSDLCPNNYKIGKKKKRRIAIIEKCPCKGCKWFKKEQQNSPTSTETPEIEQEQHLSRKKIRIRTIVAVLTLLGVGGVALSQRNNPATNHETERATGDLEPMPIDPNGRIILDKSWRAYAQENGKNLDELSAQIFQYFAASERELEHIYQIELGNQPIRVKFAIRSESMALFSSEMKIDFSSDDGETVQYNFARPEQDQSHQEITLPGIEPDYLPTIPHELAHFFNNRLGISHIRFLDEGLATNYGRATSVKLWNLSSIDSSSIMDLLRYNSDVFSIPLNPEFSNDKTIAEYSKLGEIFHRLADLTFQTFEMQNQGFLRRWIKAIYEENQVTERNEGRLLKWKEIVEIGERVIPGFTEYLKICPNSDSYPAGSKGVNRFVSENNGTIYVINLNVGLVSDNFGSDATVTWSDLIPPEPLFITCYSERGRQLGSLRVNSYAIFDAPRGTRTFQVQDISGQVLATGEIK